MSERATMRCIRLSDADWAALEAIARHHGLEWGGIPSRSEAVKVMIAAEVERIRSGDPSQNSP